MKVSIITVTYNCREFVSQAIESVNSQDYPNIEYLVIDGGSKDGTADYLMSCNEKIDVLLSEPDKGLYDAMNKGLSLATGEIIGFLHGDDFYENRNVISRIVRCFLEFQVDSVYADLVYVAPYKTDRIVRYYTSKEFSPETFAYGIMPAHPTFFVKKDAYDRFGVFSTGYKIAADFELLCRFLYKNKVSYYYLPEIAIRMRTGGISTANLKSNWILNKEILKACTENEISTNYFKIYLKYLKKISQLWVRPQ